MTYEVRFERDESGWWVATVPAVKGCHTQGRTIEEARRRVREALGLFVDDAERAELVDDVRLPMAARRAVQRLGRLRERLERTQVEQQSAAVEATRVLCDALGLSVRDAADLLGLSFQRIHQLRHTRRPAKRRAAAK